MPASSKPMVDFRHVILTRFNMASPGVESDIRSRPGWLSRRFDLFEKYCLPSVAAQTEQDFTWIIYFDKNTPNEYRERVEMCRKIHPFVPYYTGYFDATGWPRSVREVLGTMPPHLLSTRLDNDDALASDYVQRMQKCARQLSSVKRDCLVIPQGLIRSGQKLYRITHRTNAFVTWLEGHEGRVDEILTACGIPHMEIYDYGMVHTVPGQAGWLQVVHNENVSNRIRGTRIPPDSVRGQFKDSLLEGLAPTAQSVIAAENFVFSGPRKLRDSLVVVAKSLLRRLRRA